MKLGVPPVTYFTRIIQKDDDPWLKTGCMVSIIGVFEINTWYCGPILLSCKTQGLIACQRILFATAIGDPTLRRAASSATIFLIKVEVHGKGQRAEAVKYTWLYDISSLISVITSFAH